MARAVWALWGIVVALTSPAWAERTLDYTLTEGATGPKTPVQMYFDKRLTFVLPEAVQLAVPGSPDVLTAHIRDQVVVVSVIDSPYTRNQRPVTNLTVLTESGTAFTCRIEIATSAKRAPYDVVRIKHSEGRGRAIRKEAVGLVANWLEAPDEVEASTRRTLSAGLEEALERHGRRVLAEWAADGVEVLRDASRRNRGNFIYVTRHSVVRLGNRVLSQLTLTNRSQPVFEVATVEVRADGIAVPDRQVSVHVPRPRVSPDDTPRPVGLLFPASVWRSGAALSVRVCEGGNNARCVTAQLN